MLSVAAGHVSKFSLAGLKITGTGYSVSVIPIAIRSSAIIQ